MHACLLFYLVAVWTSESEEEFTAALGIRSQIFTENIWWYAPLWRHVLFCYIFFIYFSSLYICMCAHESLTHHHVWKTLLQMWKRRCMAFYVVVFHPLFTGPVVRCSPNVVSAVDGSSHQAFVTDVTSTVLSSQLTTATKADLLALSGCIASHVSRNSSYSDFLSRAGSKAPKELQGPLLEGATSVIIKFLRSTLTGLRDKTIFRIFSQSVVDQSVQVHAWAKSLFLFTSTACVY